MNNQPNGDDDQANTTLNMVGFVSFLTVAVVYYIVAQSHARFLETKVWETVLLCLPTVWLFILKVSRKFKEAYLWSVFGLVLGNWVSYALALSGWPPWR